MLGTILFLIVLAIVPVVIQMMALSVVWHRIVGRLKQQEPRTVSVIIRTPGADTGAVTQVLDHHTRLDLSEIDELVEAGQVGRLPLPLSWREAHALAAKLRGLGAEVELEY